MIAPLLCEWICLMIMGSEWIAKDKTSGWINFLSHVIVARCFVVMASGTSFGTTAERPVVPMIVMMTSPG